MNARKLKKNETNAPRKRSPKQPARIGAEPDVERLFAPEVWKEELAELSKRDFENFDDALDAVVEMLMDKLQTETANRTAEKEFLLTLFKTDPHLCAMVRGSVRTRS